MYYNVFWHFFTPKNIGHFGKSAFSSGGGGRDPQNGQNPSKFPPLKYDEKVL